MIEEWYLSRFDEEFDCIEALMRRRFYHCIAAQNLKLQTLPSLPAPYGMRAYANVLMPFIVPG